MHLTCKCSSEGKVKNFTESGRLTIREAAYSAITDDPQVIEQIEIQARYQGYIDRQAEEVARSLDQETMPLPEDLDYETVGGLSAEVRQILIRRRPQTIGQASRMQGITPYSDRKSVVRERV